MQNELGEKAGKLFLLFAEILEYPTLALYECFEECISLLLDWNSEAAKLLKKFEFFLARVALTQMQEIYTRTFDLQPACYPYVGHHLFGEDYRRGLFMAGLKRQYLSRDFSAGQELPDHLAVILRFLTKPSGDNENHELIHECLIPALEKMLMGLREEDNPYRGVLQALLLAMQKGGVQSKTQSAGLRLNPLARFV